MALIERTVPTQRVSRLTDAGPSGVDLSRLVRDRAGLSDQVASVVVSENFPASPDIVLTAGGATSLLEATQAGNKIIEVEGGNYGADRMAEGSQSNGVTLFCRTGDAIFDGGFAVGPFFQRSSNCHLRNFTVRRFIPDGGPVRFDGVKASSGIINCESVSGNLFEDLEVGISKINAYRLHGTNNHVKGGRMFRCNRFGWNGGGSNCSVKGTTIEDVGYAPSPDPEVGVAADTNRGVSKVALNGGGWVLEDLTVRRAWHGPWFDIGNEPAVLRRIYLEDVFQFGIFIEVSYGPEGTDPRWVIDDVQGVRSSQVNRDVTSDNWPFPALVTVSQTPGLNISNVRGDGTQWSTVGFVSWNHPQWSNASLDKSRMGIGDTTVSGCDLAGTGWITGWEGDARDFAAAAQHEAPEYVNNTYQTGGRVRWQGQSLSVSQFLAMGNS